MSVYYYGSFTAVSSTYIRPYLYATWTQSSAGNYSDVRLRFYVQVRHSAYSVYASGASFTNTIDGNAQNTTNSFNLSGISEVLISDRTIRVYHNADGTRNCGVSGTCNTYLGGVGTGSVSGTATLPSLAYAAAVSTSAASSIATTTVTLNGNVTNVGRPAATNKGFDLALNSDMSGHWSYAIGTGGSGAYSYNITGATAGTTYYCRAWVYNASHGYVRGAVTSFRCLKAPTVSSSAASSVAGTSATINGNVTDAGNPTASRGFRWGTTSGAMNTYISVGSGGGAFSTTLSSLARGTTYYYRARAWNSVSTVEGGTLSFTTTSSAPSITTNEVSLITFESATCGGNVTSDNGATVTTRGVCYNTTGTPTTSSPKVASGSGTGSFSESMPSLSPLTTYYVRAYATNSVGTTYGAERSFTTLTGVPDVTTQATTSIGIDTATFNGTVVSDRGATITERGFVFGFGINPTTSSSKIIASGTTGVMSSNATGLSPGSDYYVRAYAINSRGTSYGDNDEFTTEPYPPESLALSNITKTGLTLTWTKGAWGAYTIIRRGTTAPSNINSGTLVYQGTAATTTDSGLTAGTQYYYRAWSATTADWSKAYSATYSEANGYTQYNFADPTNVYTDDSNYATVKGTDELYCRVSKDNGVTWSVPLSLTFTASIEELDFGNGTTELWGGTWIGTDLDDGKFLVELYSGVEKTSFQRYKTFGFDIAETNTLTGVRVRVRAAFATPDIYIYYLKVDGYYGTSPLPVKAGSLAYDSTLNVPTFFNGTEWKPLMVDPTIISERNLYIKGKDTGTNDRELYIEGASS